MSLKDYLAVGQSFVGKKDGPSPYVMRQENLLPRFQKQPVQKVSLAAPARVLAEPAEPLFASGAKWVERAAEAEVPKVSKKMEPAVTSLPASKGPVSIWKRIRGFFKKDRTEQLVQSELKLKSVRVVCNDLSDADLEVIPAGHVKKEDKLNWNQLSAKLFIAGRDQF
ncbi:MAG: hypothetical protein SFY81_04180 [Verrucomicrobiota bacterium]|nr:hypothetical protein [Verrucomicrobiota bacterium]